MAHVTLIGPLRDHSGGVHNLEIDAPNVRRLLAALSERFPDLAPHLESGVAIAIDGQIYQDALLEPIAPDSDVHILPPIAGG